MTSVTTTDRALSTARVQELMDFIFRNRLAQKPATVQETRYVLGEEGPLEVPPSRLKRKRVTDETDDDDRERAVTSKVARTDDPLARLWALIHEKKSWRSEEDPIEVDDDVRNRTKKRKRSEDEDEDILPAPPPKKRRPEAPLEIELPGDENSWNAGCHRVTLWFEGRSTTFWSHCSVRYTFPRSLDIVFHGGFDNPEVHEYVVDVIPGGYTSISGVIHDYFLDFEKVKMQRAWGCTRATKPSSPYFGMSVEEVLGFWDRSRDNGTCKHAAMDETLQGTNVRPVYKCGKSDAITGPPKGFFRFMVDHPYLIPYATEFSVFDRDLVICGQFDALFWDTIRLCFILVDWKNVMNFKDTASEYGIDPLTANMMDCHKVKYSMQLNFYAYLLERHSGIKVADMWIVNFPPLEDAEAVYRKIEVPRMDLTPFLQKCPVNEEGRERLRKYGGEREKKPL